MFFISPPFGNYVNLPKTKRIHGSFTLEKRDGLLVQIVKTLRYSFKDQGWVNKIGLRNKGIDWALKNIDKKDILSIAILNEKEIDKFLEKIPNDRNIEINISCPNTEKKMISKGISRFIHPEREWCILKVSPIMKNEDLDDFYKQGFRQFHCSNTLPVENGGLSGKALIPYTSDKTSYIKKKFSDSIIIAGGGVDDIKIVEKYKKMGANHFSASSVFFNPITATKLYYQYISKDF